MEFYEALSFALITSLITLIGVYGYVITKYRSHIRELNDEMDLIRTEYENMPDLDISTRITAAKDLFEIINMLIEYEIVNRQQYDAFTVKKSNIGDVDKLTEQISQSVFKSLAPNLFSDKNNIVTDTCIMQYITRRTIVMLLQYLSTKIEEE